MNTGSAEDDLDLEIVVPVQFAALPLVVDDALVNGEEEGGLHTVEITAVSH